MVVAGHARTTAARNLGMDKVPVVFCDDLDDAQRRALTLVDNQTTMMTGWDEDMLAYELDTLAETFDMRSLGFVDEVSEEMFGEDFTLPDVDAPQFKTVSLHMTGEMFGEFERITGNVESSRYDGGNDSANRVLEVLEQWDGH